jgi:hypothetical protein
MDGAVWSGAAERGVAIPRGVGEESDFLDRIRRAVVVPLRDTAENMLRKAGLEVPEGQPVDGAEFAAR